MLVWSVIKLWLTFISPFFYWVLLPFHLLQVGVLAVFLYKMLKYCKNFSCPRPHHGISSTDLSFFRTKYTNTENIHYLVISLEKENHFRFLISWKTVPFLYSSCQWWSSYFLLHFSYTMEMELGTWTPNFLTNSARKTNQYLYFM